MLNQNIRIITSTDWIDFQVKIIDRYIIKSFLTTFASVFVILIFIFILQLLWTFIGELAGKGLSVWFVLKFLMYAIPTMIPLIFPLSILLASIMTFGGFAENYEFAAMKSAGMSLGRASRGLMVFILFLSGIAFFFANDVIPYSKYKVRNFRTNLQEKPSMAIAEGQFNEIGAYNIKVDKKSGDNDELLEGVVIHKKSQGKNTTVTKAKRGELVSKEDSNVLQLILYDGHHYEDSTPKKYEDRIKQPFTKADFERYVINMDLSGLMNVDLESDSGESDDGLLNVSELRYTIDSLKTEFKQYKNSIADNIHHRTSSVINNEGIKLKTKTEQTEKPPVFENKDVISIVPERQRSQIYESAFHNLTGSKHNVIDNKYNLEFKNKNIKSHQYSLHERFVVAYSCLLMFFIGAPLGAIIRKGGFGLPIVFAIIIFIAFHFTTTFGRKIAQDGTLDAFLGAWGSSMILTPLAIILTYRATNDKGMSMDRFTEPIRKFSSKIFKSKQNQNA